MKHCFLCLCVLFSSCAANTAQKSSYLVSFGYLGYCRSEKSVIRGKVTEEIANKTLSVAGAMIIYRGTSVLTNDSGFFQMEVDPGNDTVVVSKDKYESVAVLNIKADSGKLAYMTVSLASGTGKVSQSVDPKMLGPVKR